VQNLLSQVPDAPPALDVVRDLNTGAPVPDAANPSRYQARYIPLSSGTVIPAIGLIVEL